MRINNFISGNGICSRREADLLIKDGKVTINGKLAVIGETVSPEDVVLVNGKKINSKEKHVYIVFNKPVGITCTTDRNIKDNIIDFIKHKERIFPIGRLDKDSEGLIMLTSDGDIVNKILRSENNHEKEYIVKVDKVITDKFINGMINGVKIYNPVKNKYTITNKCKIYKINNYTFRIILTQGLNRQIRRMCSHFGYNVINLKRIRIMNIKLNDLKIGEYRDITKDEYEKLMNILKED